MRVGPILVALLPALLLGSARAWAYRPFNGTDADVAELHDVELEIGPVGYLREGSRGALVAPSLIANWGFASDVELVVEGRQQKTGPSVASEWTILLPETGERRFGAEAAAIVSMRWPALTLHANGNVAYTRERTLGLFGGLIVEGPAAWAVRPVAEAFVDRESATVTEWSGLAGAIWRCRESLSLDAAGRLSWIRAPGAAARAVELRAGLTWAFSIG